MTASAIIRQLWPSQLAARMTVLMVFTASLSVSIAAASMLYMAWRSEESQSLKAARKDVQAMAYSLAAPLAFADRREIHDVLRRMASRPEVVAAWVRDSRGQILARHGSRDVPQLISEGGGLSEGWLVVTEPVHAGYGANVIGTVTLRLDLGDAAAGLHGQVVAAALASLLVLVMAVILSRQVARRLSVPMVKLAEAADALTRDWAHPQRLGITGPGEVGSAIAAYNHLVDELTNRDAAVQKLTDELRETAAVAEAARATAESASVAKTRFLANMSHELRSPLNGVIGAAQLLRKSERDPMFRDELVRIIQTSGNNLLELIEGVLDVSRIEAGRIRVERQPFYLIECIESALAPAVASARVKDLDIEYHIDADVPGWCVGDAARLKQLLQNLLGNAVKFTDWGSVSLEVTREARSDRLVFRISDTGVGIPRHLRDSIFEPFQQGDPSATRRFGGSGLGLTICRDVARLMGGDVRVQSVHGAGSCFTLALPLPPVVNVANSLLLPRLGVWCHEPVEKRRHSLAALLQRLGCKAQFVDDAASAAAVAGTAGAGGGVWLIAADVPDGPAVVQAVLSSGAAPRVATLGLLAGTSSVSESLRRPVTLASLYAFLSAEEKHAQTGTLSATLLRRTLRSRVLLVEDDPVNRLVVSSLIDGKEIECVVAASGTDALQSLSTDRFDAVLMDWQMPDMDGLEATRRLRAGVCGELNRAVPVIALTANAFAEDREACMAAGMNDFLTKPVQLQALRQCVLRWCRHIETNIDERKGSAWSSDITGEVEIQGEVPVYQPAVLASLLGAGKDGEPARLQKLLRMFCSSVQTSFVEMQTAMDAADWRTLQRHAHTLKASAGQVGAMALSGQAAMLEARLRTGDPVRASDLAQLQVSLANFMEVAGLVAVTSHG
jgi:signal transduction histidine kinase/CheY-like chemotaxis protein